MPLEVKLEAFEGPLDLLLHLIDKNKINIYDIPIALVTDQYLEYVARMEKEDLNVVSEFLVMAAMLLDIKSRMLLPVEEEEETETEDPRRELVEKLLEYKMYKYMSYELKDRQMNAEMSMYRLPAVPEEVASYEKPVDLEQLMSDISLIKLREIYNILGISKTPKATDLGNYFTLVKTKVTLPDKSLSNGFRLDLL